MFVCGLDKLARANTINSAFFKNIMLATAALQEILILLLYSTLHTILQNIATLSILNPLANELR